MSRCLNSSPNATDQLDYRKETILGALKAAHIEISDCAAFSGRGGGLASCRGGVYEINDAILKDARSGKNTRIIPPAWETSSPTTLPKPITPEHLL